MGLYIIYQWSKCIKVGRPYEIFLFHIVAVVSVTVGVSVCVRVHHVIIFWRLSLVQLLLSTRRHTFDVGLDVIYDVIVNALSVHLSCHHSNYRNGKDMFTSWVTCSCY